MAKLAVFLFALVAINAACARPDIKLFNQDSTYDVERFDWKQGNDLDQYLMQLRTISKDVTDLLRDFTPTDKLYKKTLNWHCRVLSQYFDSVIEKLEKDMTKGVETVELKEFFHVLRDIQMTLRQVDELSFEQLKVTFTMTIQKYIEQIEKLVRFTQGSLTYTIKYVLVDFITIIQNFEYQLKNFGHKEYTFVQLSMEIRELTRDLTKYLQDCQFNNIHVKQTLRQYLYHLELLKNQRQLDTVLVDNELVVLCDQMYKKLYDIIVPFTQTTKYERFVNTDVLKREFITELETICEEIYKYVQHFEIKYQGTERYWIIEKILKNYLFAIYQLKTDLLKDVKVDYYNKDVFNLEGKTDLKKFEYGLDTYKTHDVSFKHLERGLTMQLFNVLEDLLNYIENLHIDNVAVKQTLTHLFRVYISNLETIVDKLEEVYTYKQFQFGTDMKEIIYNLRQYVLSLKHVLDDEYTFNTYELKNHVKVYLGKFTADLEKLMVLWQTKFDESSETFVVLKNVIVRFLTATRNFNLHLHHIGNIAYTGQNYFDFSSQIQILARDFIINLKSISIDNIMMKDVFFTRCHEYSRLVQRIIDMLETKFEHNTLYHDQVYQRVIMNLRQIVDVLEQVVKHEEITIYKLREVLITCVENTVSEMKNLLSIWQKYGQEQELQTVLYRMFHDFIVSLKYHQYQLHQVYYNNKQGQDMHQLSSQIQIITHNLINYFRNVNSYKQEHKELFVNVVRHELIRSMDLVIQRLETEVTYMDKSGVYWEVISEFKRVVDQLREVTKYDTLRTEYNMHTDLHFVLIDIAKIFERLSYFTESDMKVHENLEQVIRSVLMHYLMTIQHLQVEFNQVHYYNQIGKTPSEMVLTIEVICDRIQELLRFTVPKTVEKDLSLVVYVRNLYNSMGRIVNHLDENKMGYYNDKYMVQFVDNIKKVRNYIEKYIFEIDQIETPELHIHLRYVVDEIKKTFWVVQYGFQYDVEKYTVVKHFLDSFLLDLEYFEHYIQVSLQFVRGGLTTRDLYHQIDIVVGRLETVFQYGMSNTGKFRQIIALQVGQFCQTIKNLVYMLKTETIFTQDKDTLVYDIMIEFEQIYQHLYRFTTLDNEITTPDLVKEFYLCIRKVAVLLHKFEHEYKFQVEDHHVMEVKVVLDSVFGHYLIALRNIYIQLDNTKHFGLYQENKDLFNQIQMILNHLTTSVQYMELNTVDVKQYFIINTLYYTHRIHVITDKLEFLIKSGKFNCEGIEKILFDLRQIVVHLQEVGTASELSIVEFRNFVTAQIQFVHVEFQKLMMLENVEFETVIKGIFIDYYTTVQSFQDRVENINIFSVKHTNTDELVYYIEDVVYDISYCLRHLTYADKLVEQTFSVEYRKMYKVIDTIIEKFYSMVKVGEYKKIIDQLKDIQLLARKYTTESFSDVYQQRIQYELYLRRVSYIFKQLVWTVRSEYKDITMIPTDLTEFIRSTLYNFICTMHTTEIQFLNILENHYVKQYGFEWTRSSEYTTDVLNKNYGQDELFYKRFYPTNKYYGEKLYENYGVRTENTYELVAEIKKVVFELTKIFRGDVTLVKQDVHVYTVEIRKMIFLVDRMVQKLRMQVRDFEGDRMVLNQIIERLDVTLMSLKRVIEYTTFTGMSQLMKELDQFLFTVVEQFHKLVMIDQEYRGRFDMDLTKVLEEFLMTLQKFKYLFRYGYEHESTYQYSGDYKYGKNYGYDYDYSYNMKPQTRDMEHKSYGYGKLYDFYYKPYETVNKKFDYELKTDMYQHEDKYTIEQLVEHIKIYSTKVVKDVETIIRDADSKDVLVYQVRDLITILDQIIYKLEEVIKTNKQDVMYQVYVNLKAIRSELYEFVHSDVTITVYQIRSQFTLTIRKIAENLVKLVLNSKYFLHDNTFVYDILYQYFGYLRSIHMKLESNFENVDNMSYQYKDLVTGTHGYNGKVFTTYQLREFTTIVKRMIEKVQTKIYLIKGQELVVLRQVLVKLEYLLKELTGDFVTEFTYERFETLVRDVVYELKHAMTVFEQYYGRDYDMYIWCKDILQGFTYPVQKLFYQNKDLVHIWA